MGEEGIGSTITTDPYPLHSPAHTPTGTNPHPATLATGLVLLVELVGSRGKLLAAVVSKWMLAVCCVHFMAAEYCPTVVMGSTALVKIGLF